MSDLADELRAIGHAINHDEYIDAGVVPLTLAHAADRIEALEAALREIADDPTGVSMVQAEIAKVALALEQDK